jgi:DNA-binding XRE family transcriptional regulator
LENIIADKLKEMERNKSWLARKAGISQGYMSKIVNGQSNPTLEAAQKICQVLNSSVDDIFMAGM